MSSGIFNSDFYPTPPEVAGEMLDPLDLRGRTVLEPSAGCEIVALCNWNTVSGQFRGLQLQLAGLIEAYGSAECLGEAFSTAERPTRRQGVAA